MEPSIGRCGAFLAAGLAQWTLGQFEKANQLYHESYRIAQKLEAGRESAIAAICLGIGYLGIDMERALRWSAEAVDRGRAQGNTWAHAIAMSFDGILRAVGGDAQTAQARYTAALALQRSIGDMEGAGTSLGGLAQLASMGGDASRAIELYEEALISYEAIGDRAEEARILDEMAWTYLRLEDTVAARRRFLDAVAAYQDLASVRGVGLSLIGLAAAEALEGRPRRAVQIAAVAELLASHEGIVNVYSEGHPGGEFIARARSALSEAEVEAATGRVGLFGKGGRTGLAR
jgi:tetratricopeptide (TPR) repeat protein